MNSFKKKILLAGVVTIFAFIVTIGSTYAWFTVGQASQIGTIDLEVQTSTSLLILLDKGYSLPANNDILLNASNYSSSLTNTAITTYYDYENIVFKPITTANGTSFFFRDMSTPASFEAASTGEYVEFSVWLLSQASASNVALANLVVTAQSGATTLQSIITDCARLSVTADGTTKIFGLDKDYDFTFVQGQTGYSSTASENIIDPDNKTALIGLHSVYYIGSSPVGGQSTSDLASATTVVALAADIPEKVTIRIWMEGWDADCNNNVLNIDFTMGFSFSVK